MVSNKISKSLAFWSVGLFVFALDRFGKQWALQTLEPGERTALLGNLLGLAHVRVSGAAFGWMDDWASTTQLGALGLISLACLIVVVGFYRGLGHEEVGSGAALGALLAGVLGNFVDRLQYGAGIDFLHFGPVTALRLPDFDVADLGIMLGAVTLIVELLATEMAARAQERPPRSPPSPR
jgi:signal peptidase II